LKLLKTSGALVHRTLVIAIRLESFFREA